MENQNNLFPNEELNDNKPFEEKNITTENEKEPSAEISAEGFGNLEKLEEEYKFAPIIFPQTATPFIYSEPLPKGHTKETFEEKKRIKRTAQIVGISFLAMMGIILAVNLVAILVMAIIWAATKSGSTIKIFEDPFFLHILQIFLSSLAFTVPFVIVYKKCKQKVADFLPLNRPKKKRGLPLFLFGIGFCAFANVAFSLIGSFLEKIGIEQSQVGLENPQGIIGFLIVFISTAIVPALVEEFACRGLVMGLLRKFGDAFAIVASAVLFGLIHGNLGQIPFAFLVGLALGYIVIKSESLWPAVAVHFFNNLAAVVFSYLPLSVNLTNIIYAIFLCVCMLLGILAIFLVRDDIELFKLKKAEKSVTEGKKYIYFFTSVPIILVICYCVAEAVFYIVQ